MFTEEAHANSICTRPPGVYSSSCLGTNSSLSSSAKVASETLHSFGGCASIFTSPTMPFFATAMRFLEVGVPLAFVVDARFFLFNGSLSAAAVRKGRRAEYRWSAVAAFTCLGILVLIFRSSALLWCPWSLGLCWLTNELFLCTFFRVHRSDLLAFVTPITELMFKCGGCTLMFVDS